MLNGTRTAHPFARAKLAIVLASLQTLACGSEAPPTDANSGAPPSSAGSATTATSSSSSTPASKPSASAGASATQSSKPSGSAGSSAGAPAASSSTPASTSTAGAAAPAAGSGASSSAPKGDVPSETSGAAGAATTGAAGSAGGSQAAAGSTGAAAGSGSEAATPAEDFGKGDGKDVITIGDSWMNIATNGGGIEGGLDRAGTMYRHYAVAGTTLLNGGQIPGEYDQAKAVNPDIKTIVMTGGGNDVMFSGGCNTKESCTAFSQMIADGLSDLWTRAQKDGVSAAVYIQYSKNAGTAPADTRPDNPAIPKICLDGKFRCVFINTTDLIAASDTVDGIHPTFDGCDRIAKRVEEEMEKAGVRR